MLYFLLPSLLCLLVGPVPSEACDKATMPRPFTRVLRQADPLMNGSDVVILQHLLKRHVNTTAITGVFDSQTTLGEDVSGLWLWLWLCVCFPFFNSFEQFRRVCCARGFNIRSFYAKCMLCTIYRRVANVVPVVWALANTPHHHQKI